MNATDKPQCPICPARHRASEPHDTSKVTVRPWVREFVRSEPATVPGTKPRTVSVTPLPRRNAEVVEVSVTGTYDDGPEPDRSCIQCGAAFKGKRATARFCSAKCRVRASRKK